MASLISQAEKDELSSSLIDVFDTFKRPIAVYEEPEKIIISTNPNYSRFGQRDQNVFNPEVEPISHTIEACILYEAQQPFPVSVPLNNQDDAAQLKLKYPDGRIRVKIKKEDYAIFSKAKLVELDGQNFELDSPPRVHGLFGTGLYTFYLNHV